MGFDQGGELDLARVPIAVGEAVIESMKSIHHDMARIDDFEAPGLCVVAIGNPSR